MKLLGLIVLSAALIFSSCTKTVTNPSPVPTVDTLIIRDTVVIKDTIALQESNPIAGLWIGTLSANNEPGAGPLYYSFDIRADNSMLTYSLGADGNTYYSEGTWALSGSAFTATITSTSASNKGIVQLITAVYNKPDGSLSGSWENQNGTADGTFTLKRVN